MKNLRILAILFACLYSLNSTAAFIAAKIKVTGVTCSMCSNAVNKALSALPFVENIVVDLENAIFKVAFRPGTTVIVDDLRKKVEGAGFSIGELVADFQFENTSLGNDFQFLFENSSYHFISVKGQKLNGIVALRFVDKGLASPAVSKKFSAQAKHPCIKTGRQDDCSEHRGAHKVYHVTI